MGYECTFITAEWGLSECSTTNLHRELLECRRREDQDFLSRGSPKQVAWSEWCVWSRFNTADYALKDRGDQGEDSMVRALLRLWLLGRRVHAHR